MHPEEGDSFSAGLTYTPTVMPDLSLNLDWWRTELDDVITLYPDVPLILGACADFGAAEALVGVGRENAQFIAQFR